MKNYYTPTDHPLQWDKSWLSNQHDSHSGESFFGKIRNSLYLLLLPSVLCLCIFSASAQFSNVPVTGFNSDQVANGIGLPTTSTTVLVDNGVDPGNYVFIDGTYQYTGACAAATTNILPASGTITSMAAVGLTYNLQPYSGNNALRIPATGTAAASATLNVVTPVSASTVYLLCVAGGGAITGNDFTVNFTDLTSQTFSNITAEDWCNTTNNGNYTKITTTQYFRVQATTATCGSQATCQYLAELALPLLPGNYSKSIASVTVSKTNTTFILNVYAMGVKAPCAVPTAQATALTGGAITTGSIAASFTNATTLPTGGYLVVRYPTGATTTAPVNGTNYTAGQALGTGTIIANSLTTSFTASGLNSNTAYDFYVYAYNNGTTCGGPVYLTTTPLTATLTTNACGTTTGTIQVGAGKPNTLVGGFTSISNALTALNTSGIGGNVVLELQSNYDGTAPNETFPIAIPYNSCVSATKTITVRPATGVTGLVITSDSLQTININGGSYFIFDGRPGGTGTTGQLKIINTKSTGAAIQFINDAHHNIFRYCDVQGQNTSATSTALSGVIYFAGTTTAALNGNDNNTIANCDIHATINDFPAIAICSYGLTTAAPTTNWNDSNTITNCNIYDFYSATLASTAIKLDGGSNAFTISNNKIYQTATRNFTASNQHRAFWLTPSATGACGFQVINNFIGGDNTTGTGVWTLTSAASILTNFWGMDINHAGLGRTSVQGNTITNISLSSNTATLNDLFRGISTGSTGNFDIGTITGNTIGSGTGTGAIQLITSATGSTSYGIKVGSTTDTTNVYNNTIGSITLSSATTANALNFQGIGVTGSGYANIVGNTIGSFSTPLSINSLDSATTNGQALHGISVTTGIYTSIINNKVVNLNNCYKGTVTTAYTRGIYLTVSTTSVITGNLVSNISTASTGVGTGTSAALVGIQMSSANPSTVTGNTIDSLVLTSPSTAIASMVEGIVFSSNGAVPINLVTRNFIHSFDVTAANASAIMIGIDILGGANIIANNMIRLGVKPDGTDVNTALVIRGIYLNTTTAESVHHNSVYIGGTGVGTTATNTAAVYRNASVAGSIHDIRNNIFVNERSNATTGGKHYQVYLNNTTALAIGSNVYYGTGTGSVFATLNGGTSDVAGYYAQGWLTSDLGGSTSNPRFLNTTGNVSTVNLHISPSLATPVESAGALVASVNDDYDGQTRNSLSPVDIGADAGTFTPLPMFIDSTMIDQNTNQVARGATNQYILRVRMYAKENYPLQLTSFALSTLGSTSAADITSAKVFSTGSNPNFSANTQYGSTVSAPSGAFTVTGTAALAAGVNYFWVTYDISNTAVLNNVVDARVTNIVLAGSVSPAIVNGDPAGARTIKQALSGPYNIGGGQTYPTITAAMTDLNALGVSGAVIFNLMDAIYPLTDSVYIGVIPGASATNTVTLRPDATNVAGALITSSGTVTFELSGATYFTFDGRPGGATSPIAVPNTTNLNIVNTNLSGTAIRFNNDSRFNTVKYCDLQGKNNVNATLQGTSAGVVFFGSTNGINGNDNNTIDNCNIHSINAADTLTMGIYAAGPASSSDIVGTFNDSNKVTNCNIYNMYGANNLSTGGIVLDRGNNAWTISGNSFFYTVARTQALTANVSNRNIYINTTNTTGVGNGFTITGNYFGGSQPLCGGTLISNTTGAFTNLHEGIFLATFGGTATNIKGNTFTNLNISQGANTGDVYHALWVAHNGNVNFGGPLVADGNLIGSMTTTGAITLSSTGTTTTPSHMIIFINTGTATPASNMVIQNNKIGGVLMTGTGNSFSGIYCASASTYLIDNNMIGSPTVPNSINVSYTGTVASFVRGMLMPAGAGIFTVTNNTIANLNNNCTSTTTGANNNTGSIPHTIGILLSTTSNVGPVVTGNIIKNLSCAAPTASTGTSAAVSGLGVYAISAITPANVSNNKIDSLISTSISTTTAVAVTGIVYAGNTAVTNIVAKNYVDNMDVSAVNTNAIIKGIELTNGNINVVNNMVRLGIHNDGTPLTTALSATGILKSSTGNVKLYHNSVYIGGTGVGNTAKNTAAYQRSGTGVDEVRNNIFVNNRSNATTGGKHYQLLLNAPTTITVNNNIYFGNGTGAVFATANGTVDTVVYKAGWIAGDLNSIVGDPQFIDATAASATANLHLHATNPTPAEASGIALSLVTDDYDGQARSSNTPADIGADAGNFVQSDLVGPAIGAVVATNTSLTTNRTIAVAMTDNSGVATAANAPKVYYYKSSGGVAGAYSSSAATLASGTAQNGTWNFTIVSANMGGLVLGDSVYYYISAQDASAGTYFSSSPAGATSSGTIPPPTLYSYKIVQGYAGNINIGIGQTFTSLTAIGGIFDSINKGSLSADVTLTVTSDLLLENGAVALSQWSESGAGNYKVSIVPNAATERLIAGSAGTGLIRFDGADRVKIDGRFAGSGRYLRFRNRSTAGTTVTFINDAQRDTLTFCTIEGLNTSSGVILLSTTNLSTGTGNDFNSINNCNIGDTLGSVATSSRPSTIVSSVGTTNFENSDNSIVNNNMYNFTGNGINITTANGDNWNITGNSLYNTMPTPPATTQTVINFTPGLLSANNRITGNYIGGAAPLAAGAAYVNSGNVVWKAISANFAITDSSFIQNNTIQNLSLTGIGSGSFTGIEVLGGMVSITGNTIGHNTTTNSIQTPLLGTIIGIWINNANISARVDNNLVGNITSTGATNAIGVNGIRVASANTVAPLSVRNNTIKNMSGACPTVATTTAAAVGILSTYAGTQQSIIGNTISGLTNNGAAAVSVFGINISSSGATGVVASNMVYGLNYTGNNNGSQIVGIHLDLTYNITVVNNMISLGYNVDSSAFVVGIMDKSAGVTNSVYYNSVRISGVALSPSATLSQAYRRTTTSGTAVKNNIFNNSRTGGIGNYAIGNASTTPGTGWVANNNIFSSANATQIGLWSFSPTTLAAWKSTSLYDTNSVSYNVNFISNTDLHVTTGSIGNGLMAGKPIAGFTTDIDGATRSTTFPYIGADENAAPVPVKLLWFRATSNNTDVALLWRTASEVNNLGFEVLRSVDGKRFDMIDFVKGAGNSSVAINYSLDDVKAFDVTNSDKLYYQLRQVDLDGEAAYSDIISVNRTDEGSTAFSIAPNPFNSAITLSMKANSDDVATIQVMDLQGKVVASFSKTILKGANTISVDGISGLKTGVYFVKLTTTNEIFVSKVIKE